jgi:uncharacterized protein
MQVRNHMLECKNKQRIHDFLTTARVGYLGLTHAEQPYVVPLNYVWWEGNIYFHGADVGRKVDMMEANPRVCFTVSEEYGTIANPVPAKTDTAYMSVMAFGTVGCMADLSEARAALQNLLDKYVPGYFDRPLLRGHVKNYRSGLGNGVSVFRISVHDLTAKENPLHEEMKFCPGRKRSMDAMTGKSLYPEHPNTQ